MSIQTCLYFLFPILNSFILGRQKGENKSLFFQIIPAHPLLKLTINGIKSDTDKIPEIQLLPGQIMKSILIIKNEGAAPAMNVALKFSHPNFVLSFLPKEDKMKKSINNLNLVPFYGQSCTVLKLNKSSKIDDKNADEENLIILPGEEVRYGFYLKMVELGSQTVSILTSYTAQKSGSKFAEKEMDKEKGKHAGTDGQSSYDKSGEYFGTGLKCRTSILLFEVRKHNYIARTTLYIVSCYVYFAML